MRTALHSGLNLALVATGFPWTNTALGMLVDDAIVVGENIYSLRRRGLPFVTAAIEGTRQVAVPDTFAIATNIVAFLPLLFVVGIMGRIIRVVPIVVISAFAVSLIEALFILPAHLGHSKRSKVGVFGLVRRRQQAVADAIERGGSLSSRQYMLTAHCQHGQTRVS